MSKVVLHTRDFDSAILELIRTSKRDISLLMRDQARLLIKAIVEITPPSNIKVASSGEVVRTIGLKAKKAGERTVESDIRKIIAPA